MLFSTNGAKNGHRKRVPPDTAWVVPFLATLKAIDELRLGRLTPPQRLIAARGFAFHVGNCNATERTNLTNGTTAAKGLASIAYGGYGEWTVFMHRDLCLRAKRMRGDVPTLDPWIFKVALAAPERQAL